MTTTAWASLTSSAHGRARDSAVLVLPIGATEQHGPHLPVGTDAMIADHVARSAAARLAKHGVDVIVAPPLAYGSSHHHLPVPGTLSLTSTTLHAVLVDLLTSAAATGYRRLVVLNGHGGNEDIARQAVRDVACQLDVVAACAGYWTLGWDAVLSVATQRGVALVPGHAGAFETAIGLALWPDLVEAPPSRPDARPEPTRTHPYAALMVEQHRWVHRIGGYTDDPASATAAAGHAIVEVLVDACTRHLQRFVDDHPTDDHPTEERPTP